MDNLNKGYYPIYSVKGWIITGIISISLHIMVIVYLLRSPMETSPMLMGAVMLEFSDPPQSISILENLPVGPLQQMVLKTQLSEYQEESSSIEDFPSVDELSPPDIQPEIAVKKQEKKAIEQDKQVKQTKDLLKKRALVKQPKPNQVNNAKVDKVESAYSNNLNSAPIDGNEQKVASTFTSSSQGHSTQVTWQAEVRSHLEKYLRYPPQALSKRWKGRTLVKVVIDHSGRVLSTQLYQSGNRREFDKEAIDNVKRASPLPKPPKHLLLQDRLEFIVPINFDYDKYRRNP